MLNLIESIFFLYIFIGLYMLLLLLFIYLPNRQRIFSYPIGRPEKVSIVVPCYNAASSIALTLDSLLKLEYPKGMIEIIVVDDKSKDNTAEIIRDYTRKYNNVRLIINKSNSGGAAEPTNIGVKAAKHNIIAVADDDSSPEPDALLKMIGFLQEDEKVAAVTCAVMSRKPGTFMQKLQALEYSIIAWNRKLLDCVDSVYVTPGPFALYKKKLLVKVGLFDTKNLTQDIEIVWRLLSRGYKARMCLSARVYTSTPEHLKAWFKQRVRWNIGGTQTMLKYKHLLFRRGMLGAFIIPFFSLSLFLGLIGLSLFAYLFTRKIILWYITTHYSLYADVAILHLQEFSFAPSILNFFGAVLFLAGTFFIFLGLGIMKQPRFGKGNLFNVGYYIVVYLAIYPIIMITALVKYMTGRYSW